MYLNQGLKWLYCSVLHFVTHYALKGGYSATPSAYSKLQQSEDETLPTWTTLNYIPSSDPEEAEEEYNLLKGYQVCSSQI
jgi:hypothetical protein